jgi:hypothetical protein
MAESETGFTFVDKRSVQPDPSDENIPKVPIDSAADEAVEMKEEASGGQQSPGTYDLIGYCLNLLASQAWQKLGLLADPQTGEAKPDLVEAKLAIDVVGDLAAHLESASDSQVPADMRRELRVLLNDLRLNYVARHGDDTPYAL